MSILKIILITISISIPVMMMILSLSLLAASINIHKSQILFIRRIFKLLNIDDSIYDKLENTASIDLDGMPKNSWY